MEELAKHRDYLNGFALRIYRNRVTETVRFERKELEEKINHKLDEIAQKYTQSNKLSPPVREITEVQNSKKLFLFSAGGVAELRPNNP